MAGRDEAKDVLGILEDYTPAKEHQASESERELVARLNGKFDEARRGRFELEQQWETNRLYLKGQQLVVRNRSTNEVFRISQENTRRLISVSNIIRPTARSLHAKLTRVIPTCSIIPPSSDVADMEAAKTGESLLQYHFRRLQLDRVYSDWNRDITAVGTGIVKLSWDRSGGLWEMRCEECGNKVELDEFEDGDVCPACQDAADLEYEKQTEEAEQERQVYADSGGDPFEIEMPMRREDVPALKKRRPGDVKVEVIDYRDFFVDPQATSLEDAQWVCHRVPMAVNELRRRFPKKGAYLEEENGIYHERVVQFSSSGNGSRYDTKNMSGVAYLYEFHERPTGENPDGRIIWMANDIIVEEMESPYWILDRFPFYVGYWERNKGEFWGEGFIDQSWHLQREYNNLVTQMREHRELTNMPRMLVPINAMMSTDEVDTTAGRIYLYNSMAGGKPEFMPTPPLSSYVYQETGRLEGSMRQQASVSEQEAGITSSDASGRYAAIMEAQAAQQVGAIIRYNNAEWKELHRGMLILTQEFYQDDRLWTIVGTDGPKTYYFNQANLRPGWDIDLQEEDSLSTNSAVRLQQLQNMWGMGLFMDAATGAPDVGRFAKVAKLKFLHESTDVDSSERARASAMPLAIEAGEEHTPKPWDNADIWADELTKWLRGPGRNASPEIEQKVAQWWTFYMQRTQAALQQQAMAQQQQGGEMAPPANVVGGAGVSPTSGGALEDAQQTVESADSSAEMSASMMPGQES